MKDKKVLTTTHNTARKVSLLAGAIYLMTFVSIPTLVLYGPIHDPNFLVNGGANTNIIIGGVLEIIVALSGIGTAVVLYPVLKKQNQTAALALVAARILESGTIFVGVAFLLSIVTLKQAGVGANGLLISQAFVALYDRIFLLGQSFMPAICDILLGVMLYKSRLVPRGLSLIGIIGAPLLVAGYLAILFGLVGRLDPIAGLVAIPVALFEFSLGIWLIVKGFNSQALKTLESD